MNYKENTANCDVCNKQVLVRATSPNHVFHLMMTIITLGLWSTVWFYFTRIDKPIYRCSYCGYKINDSKIGIVHFPIAK